MQSSPPLEDLPKFPLAKISGKVREKIGCNIPRFSLDIHDNNQLEPRTRTDQRREEDEETREEKISFTIMNIFKFFILYFILCFQYQKII